MKKALIVIVILLLVFIAAGGLAALWFMNNLDQPLDPASEEQISVEIPDGTGANAIGQILEDNGVIKSATMFKIYLKTSSHEGVMKAGKYTLSPSMTMGEIIDKLIANEIDTVSFTLPEGLTIEQTAARLAEQNMGTYEAFMDAIENGSYDYDWLKGNPLEGYLLPNTYTVDKDMSETEIVDFLLKQFEQTVLPIYDDAKKSIKKKYTLHEILTAASIIERECMVDDERPLVASVIYNRMDQNIMLQMCSTIQYLLLKETGEVKETLLNSDLEIDSPYNTYIHYGLPPGPICSPGIASIKAALNPEKTEYLYFVLSAKLDGTSEFSRDYSKFLKDKDDYYAALNKRDNGGK